MYNDTGNQKSNCSDHSPLSEPLLSLRGVAALLILSIVICMLASVVDLGISVVSVPPAGPVHSSPLT